jgi:hypothetical protein
VKPHPGKINEAIISDTTIPTQVKEVPGWKQDAWSDIRIEHNFDYLNCKYIHTIISGWKHEYIIPVF